jgi:hypothetical protein
MHDLLIPNALVVGGTAAPRRRAARGPVAVERSPGMLLHDFAA